MPVDLDRFDPTPDAAVDPEAYAKSRNALRGAVTRLSPYFTHGLLDLPDALSALQQRHPALGPQHKLVMEFGWREFFAHVWRHQGERIFRDLRPQIRTERYAMALPADVIGAATGVPVIDAAVRDLYATGYLHNHARLWLASYVVHCRKVHWRVGADWLYGHLLDGELSSNHLSWQWVAGTFSVKPYLFNAENVARYAPADWHSPGTVIDTSYEALDALARAGTDSGPERNTPAPTMPPPLHAQPPEGLLQSVTLDALATLPERVRLVHPWHLGEAGDATYRLGVVHLPFHSRFPWSERRWAFVSRRLHALCHAVFVGDLDTALQQLAGRSLTARATLQPGYADVLGRYAVSSEPVPRFLDDPPQPCQSFSRFYGLQTHQRWHR
jgi:deoxyribodipyrimidine photo-lyase